MFEVLKDATGMKIQYDFGNMFGRRRLRLGQFNVKEI